MRTTQTWTVSLPPNLVREAERTAKEEDRTKSEWSGKPCGCISRSAAGGNFSARRRPAPRPLACRAKRTLSAWFGPAGSRPLSKNCLIGEIPETA